MRSRIQALCVAAGLVTAAFALPAQAAPVSGGGSLAGLATGDVVNVQMMHRDRRMMKRHHMMKRHMMKRKMMRRSMRRM